MKASKSILAVLGLVLFTAIGAPLIGMAIGVNPLFVAGAIITLSAIPKPAGALFMAVPDVSAITTSFVQFGGEVLRNQVNALEIASDPFFRFMRNVSKPTVLPKVSFTGNPRPYRAADDTSGNGPSFGDRVLTVYQSKWDFDLDFEEFRNTYLAEADLQNAKPFYQVMLDQGAKEYLASINDNVAWLGDYNASGSTAASIANGWGTIIADEITATNLTPVVTGAVSAGAIDAVEAMVSALPAWLRNMPGVTLLCSYQTFDYYRADYRTNHGYTFQPRAVNEYYIDNTNIRIRPVSFMGTSGRLVVTAPKNLAFGMDGNGLGMPATARRNIIEVRALAPVGFQIADLAAIYVNDQA